MAYPSGSHEQRRDPRVSSELPVTISIGTQLSLQGHLKDISQKSAFIRIRNSVFLEMNDEVGFAIHCSSAEEDVIAGNGFVTRIMPGEGMAICFVDLDGDSDKRLKKLLESK